MCFRDFLRFEYSDPGTAFWPSATRVFEKFHEKSVFSRKKIREKSLHFRMHRALPVGYLVLGAITAPAGPRPASRTARPRGSEREARGDAPRAH